MALVRKDWYVSRRQLLMPLWFVIGAILFIGIAYLASSDNVRLGFYQVNVREVSADPGMVQAMAYGTNYGMTMATGVLCLIFLFMLGGSALNRDTQRNCEVFYRSQPISLWAITSSKFIVNVLGLVVMHIVISIITFVLSNGFTWFFYRSWCFGPAFSGFAQGIVQFASVIVFVGSMAMFCSALFRHRAVGIGIAFIAGISIITVLVNQMYHMKLPVLFAILVQMNRDVFDTGLMMLRNGYHSWSDVFQWLFWKRWLLSALFFAVSSWIYQIREIRQSE
jgi:hypothetical protein